ncbi:tetratricopeptide repeat protein [Nocardia jiangsuensis]|uniref:Tetratricopeptide repeat protein n=1 Tax=Nocardia jiangsuensis TaxID=1691563 RepID=A0ABV8E347_9NOCA
MQAERVLRVTGVVAGSGYLIAPRLVLTSAHVVGASETNAAVSRPGIAGRFTGTVVWRGTPGGRDDAALVLLDDPAWKPEQTRPVAWGRLVTDRPGTKCQTWGLPDFAQRNGSAAETAQHTGRINPGSGTVHNRYVVELDDHPPAALGGSPWKGISGAGVFCGRLLTGVIAADPAHRSHAALSAVPAYVLLARPEFRAAVEQHAGSSGLRWEPVELGGLMDQQSPLRYSAPLGSPSSLLQARRAVVPFRSGREQLLAELQAWTAEPGVGVWLLHGPGGQGKTRLAHYFGERLATERWSVLWLDPAQLDGEKLQVLGEVKTPLLVILDYAESRPGQIEALFEAVASATADRQVKMLLLARTVGDWWTSIAAESVSAEDITERVHTTRLAPLDSTRAEREATFEAAVTAFAGTLPFLPETDAHDWERVAAGVLESSRRDLGKGTTVLGVQMQALADLLDTAADLDSTGVGHSPEDRVLLHERRYWKKTMGTAGLTELGMPVLEDTVAATVVLGPATDRNLDLVIARIPDLADQPAITRRKVRAWLMSLYPGQVATAFGGLAPDRLAEYLVGQRILDPARPSIIEAFATSIRDPTRAEYFLTVCTRAAGHPTLTAIGEHLIRWCDRNRANLLPAAVAIATRVESPQPLLTAIERAVPVVDMKTLQYLYGRIPQHTQALAPTAIALLQPLVDRLRATTDADTSTLAWALSHLTYRLGRLGRREDSLAAAQETVQLCRALAEQRPSTFLPTLATSLDSLASSLDDLGRREDVLVVAEEAVRIRRALADQRPDAFLSDLAKSLNNLAMYLGDLGRREDGLAAAEEAVQIYRKVAERRPDASRPTLALCLNNLANRLGSLGRHGDALAAAEEADRHYRMLAEQNPDAFLPDFAMSSSNLGRRLGNLGRREEGLAAVEEGVRLYRVLADQRPDAFLPKLSTALLFLSDRLSDLGRREEGLAAAEEAIRIDRVLAEQYPDAFESELAKSLDTLIHRLADLDRHEDSLAARQEITLIYRKLAEHRPHLFLPDLASSLHNLAVRFRFLDRRQDALAAAEEAVRVQRVLADERAGLFLPALAACLESLARDLDAIERHEDGVAAIEEAAQLYQRLAEQHADTYQPLLADTLSDLAIRLRNLGRRNEALTTEEKAAKLYWKLDKKSLDTYLPSFAASMRNLAVDLDALGRRQDGRFAAAEAVRHYEKLAERDPRTYQSLLTRAQQLAAHLAEE